VKYSSWVTGQSEVQQLGYWVEWSTAAELLGRVKYSSWVTGQSEVQQLSYWAELSTAAELLCRVKYSSWVTEQSEVQQLSYWAEWSTAAELLGWVKYSSWVTGASAAGHELAVEKLNRQTNQVLIRLQQNWLKQEAQQYILRYTKLSVLFGIRKNYLSSRRSRCACLWEER